MAPVSKAQQKAVAKYMKTNYDEVKLRVPKGQKQALQAHAKAKGYDSLNAYFKALAEQDSGLELGVKREGE